MRSGDKETLLKRGAQLAKAFQRIEQPLGEGPYFKGTSLSAVDIAWLPLLPRAAIVERYTGYDFFAAHPKVKAWQSALLANPLTEKSVAGDFEEKFTTFYLSPQTYLGKMDRSRLTS